MWFRRERARHVAWAGDPDTPVLPGPADGAGLRPRASFEAWIEEVRGRAEPWTDAHVAAARAMARAVADAMLSRARERLAYLGLHDALTGLPNRTQFERLLDAALERADGGGRPLAVLFVDVDRFKAVNDRLGHAAGDELLRACADRLRGAIREGDVAARLGGDEFIVLCEDVTPARAAGIAARIGDSLSAPLTLAGERVTMSASVGLQVSSPGMDARALVAGADQAMYAAKRARRHPGA